MLTNQLYSLEIKSIFFLSSWSNDYVFFECWCRVFWQYWQQQAYGCRFEVRYHSNHNNIAFALFTALLLIRCREVVCGSFCAVEFYWVFIEKGILLGFHWRGNFDANWKRNFSAKMNQEVLNNFQVVVHELFIRWDALKLAVEHMGGRNGQQVRLTGNHMVAHEGTRGHMMAHYESTRMTWWNHSELSTKENEDRRLMSR